MEQHVSKPGAVEGTVTRVRDKDNPVGIYAAKYFVTSENIE
jgi:hypothetical protein